MRDGSGNPMAVYKQVEEIVNGKHFRNTYLLENTLYGSKRLGTADYGSSRLVASVSLQNTDGLELHPTDEYNSQRGYKRYELSNHLGNVLAVVSDMVNGHDNGGTADYYAATVISASDYYPYGWVISDRKYVDASGGHRYGFNGQEQDAEWRGGQAVSFRFRIHDPRLGKFLSVDPLAPEYPWYTPYQFAGNKVIMARELEGLEELITIDINQDGGAVSAGLSEKKAARLVKKRKKFEEAYNNNYKTLWKLGVRNRKKINEKIETLYSAGALRKDGEIASQQLNVLSSDNRYKNIAKYGPALLEKSDYDDLSTVASGMIGTALAAPASVILLGGSARGSIAIIQNSLASFTARFAYSNVGANLMKIGLNSELVNEAGAVVWGLGTDQQYPIPISVGDDVSKTLRQGLLNNSIGNNGVNNNILQSSRTNLGLVIEAGERAFSAIPGRGLVIGTRRHQYATKLLEKYQGIYGSRSINLDVPFNNGPGNRGRLDAIDITIPNAPVIYDWKFGTARLRTRQRDKYSRNFGPNGNALVFPINIR